MRFLAAVAAGLLAATTPAGAEVVDLYAGTGVFALTAAATRGAPGSAHR